MKINIIGGFMKKKIICIIAMCFMISSCGKVDEGSQKVMTDIDSIGTVELSDQELIEKLSVSVRFCN